MNRENQRARARRRLVAAALAALRRGRTPRSPRGPTRPSVPTHGLPLLPERRTTDDRSAAQGARPMSNRRSTPALGRRRHARSCRPSGPGPARPHGRQGASPAAMIRFTIDRDQIEPGVPPRPSRRLDYVEQALAPLRGELSADEFPRLCTPWRSSSASRPGSCPEISAVWTTIRSWTPNDGRLRRCWRQHWTTVPWKITPRQASLLGESSRPAVTILQRTARRAGHRSSRSGVPSSARSPSIWCTSPGEGSSGRASLRSVDAEDSADRLRRRPPFVPVR